MQNNMRKMFTEKQIGELAKEKVNKMISDGEIPYRSPNYFLSINFFDSDSQHFSAIIPLQDEWIENEDGDLDLDMSYPFISPLGAEYIYLSITHTSEETTYQFINGVSESAIPIEPVACRITLINNLNESIIWDYEV